MIALRSVTRSLAVSIGSLIGGPHLTLTSGNILDSIDGNLCVCVCMMVMTCFLSLLLLVNLVNLNLEVFIR